MSLTQDHLDGRFSEALARWADQLAVGASWEEVEADIVTCCQGRVDLLTQLLIHVETRAIRPVTATGPVVGQPTVGDAHRDDPTSGSASRRVVRVAPWRPIDAAVWYVPQ